MTSGQFHSLEISTIQINREGRQRRDLGDISDLSDSIRRIGLVNPICITRTFDLVAGERRLNACRALGWTHIPCHFTDELDTATLRSIELEENIKRKALDWKDECRGVNEFHEIKKAENSLWTQTDTAKALGYAGSDSVSERLSIVAALNAGNKLVTDAPMFSTAKGIVRREAERRDATTLEELRKITNKPEFKEADSIICADFNEWYKTYSGPKFNFIHCDFPYGIDADKFNQGAADTHGGYDDSEKTYWALCSSLASFLSSSNVADSCHVMFWFSMHYYESTRSFFHRSADLKFDPFPLIWTKSDNVGILPDPQRGPRRIYETAFFGSRGDRKIVRSKSNSISFPSERSTHMSIKPEGMLRQFFEMFVDSSTIFLDPTCGSGSSLRAAERCGARLIIGLERDPTFAEGARLALSKFRQAKEPE